MIFDAVIFTEQYYYYYKIFYLSNTQKNVKNMRGALYASTFLI